MRTAAMSPRTALISAFGFSSIVSVGFFVVSAVNNHTLANSYLVWNLLLAWLPMLFVVWLLKVLPNYSWLSWRPLLLTALWLLFLPNSFYLVSDLIHLQEVAQANVLYDSVMFEAFILTGLAVGYSSLYLVHEQLIRRTSKRLAAELIGLAILVCSFAIYLGRDQRLNSWALLSSPASILFDISEVVIDPRHHLQAFTTTLAFFVLLATIYFVTRSLAFIVRRMS